jgi:hypothetical protein
MVKFLSSLNFPRIFFPKYSLWSFKKWSIFFRLFYEIFSKKSEHFHRFLHCFIGSKGIISPWVGNVKKLWSLIFHSYLWHLKFNILWITLDFSRCYGKFVLETTLVSLFYFVFIFLWFFKLSLISPGLFFQEMTKEKVCFLINYLDFCIRKWWGKLWKIIVL